MVLSIGAARKRLKGVRQIMTYVRQRERQRARAEGLELDGRPVVPVMFGDIALSLSSRTRHRR